MIEPKLKLKVVQKGTHNLTWEEANNDVPNPASVVAEVLADLEFRIAELVRIGGLTPPPHTFQQKQVMENLRTSVNLLNNSLIEATNQNWKLELEQNPNVP